MRRGIQPPASIRHRSGTLSKESPLSANVECYFSAATITSWRLANLNPPSPPARAFLPHPANLRTPATLYDIFDFLDNLSRPSPLEVYDKSSSSMEINSSTPRREVLFRPGRAGSIGCGQSERGRIPIQEPFPGVSSAAYGHNPPTSQI